MGPSRSVYTYPGISIDDQFPRCHGLRQPNGKFSLIAPIVSTSTLVRQRVPCVEVLAARVGLRLWFTAYD